MSKKRVFISFDYDNDKDLKELLVGQSKNSDTPFDIADCSLKEVLRGNWKEKVREKIKKVNAVAVICGKHTANASGVNAEVKIAQEERVPYFLLKGRKDGGNQKPRTAKEKDKMYGWEWETLKDLIDGKR